MFSLKIFLPFAVIKTMRDAHTLRRKKRSSIPGFFLFFLFSVCCLPAHAMGIEAHRKISGPFSSLAEANRQCMDCHKQQAEDIRKSIHWSWQRQRVIGGTTVLSEKSTDLSRFGIAAGNNPAACRRCHLSAIPGTAPMAVDESAVINCLVCHDSTGAYGPNVQLAALIKISQTVGKPTVRNCRTCHDQECGLGPKTLRPPPMDVHIRCYGFTCRKCHPGNGRHDFKRMMASSTDRKKAQGCASCHGKNPHALARLDQHAILIGCQSCHIPEYGNNNPAVISWNWLLDNSPYVLRQKNALFVSRGFIVGKNIAPVYLWDDGSDELYTRGTRVQPDRTTRLQGPGPRTPASQIMPFRLLSGIQLYDAKYRYLLSPELSRPQAPFFKGTNLNSAVTKGMRELRLPYSGRYGIATTVAFRRLNHGVAPANKALDCLDCHGGGARFNWRALGYEQDPWTNDRENMKTPPPAQALPTIGLPPVQESVLPAAPDMPVMPSR